jgi:hypothetical protein
MPNHVSHEVEFSGNQEKIDELFAFIKGENLKEDEETHIDFEKIIPLPEELRANDFPKRIVSQAEYDEWIRKRDNNELTEYEKENKPITQKMSDDLNSILKRKYGYDNWYDWRLNFWNTKWNAYYQRKEENTIFFDTAWSTPFQIFKKLSEIFPQVTINVKFADEDFGYNCGNYVYEEGVDVFEELPQGGTYEAYKFANEIKCYYNHIEEIIEGINDLDNDNLEGEYSKFFYELLIEKSNELTQEDINSLEQEKIEAIINTLKRLNSDGTHKDLIDKLEESLDNKITFFS